MERTGKMAAGLTVALSALLMGTTHAQLYLLWLDLPAKNEILHAIVIVSLASYRNLMNTKINMFRCFGDCIPSYSGGLWFSSRPGDRLLWLNIFSAFCHSLQANVSKIPHAFFRVGCSLITVTFVAILSELLTPSPTKSELQIRKKFQEMFSYLTDYPKMFQAVVWKLKNIHETAMSKICSSSFENVICSSSSHILI
jgi:hypothetical protein